MSKRAKEAALKTYPDKEVNGVSLVFSEQRRLFQEGYELAEKDLAEEAEKVIKEIFNPENTEHTFTEGLTLLHVQKTAFKFAYEQAEKDLALTAEDVSCIIHLADQFGKDYQRIADIFNKDREEEDETQ